MLAFARAMGETAPLLLTALGNDLFIELNPTKRMSTLSLQIFATRSLGSEPPKPVPGGSAYIGLIVLLFTVAARLIASRSSVGRRR